MADQLVTKQTLKQWIAKDATKTVGRALVALFNRQTESEKGDNATKKLNGIGFSANDARIGCLGAKYFLKHGKLEDWQLKAWLKDVKGYPYICKYHRQLNEIAVANLNIGRSKV